MIQNFRPKDKQAGRYRERNALIALKALANWLAEKRLWYEARGGDYLSILRDVKLPPIPSLGRKPFTDREVKEMLETIPKVARFPLRERAIMTLQVSAPIRPDEVRRLLLRDFHESDQHQGGHLVVRGSKTEAGTNRVIPLDREAEDAIRRGTSRATPNRAPRSRDRPSTGCSPSSRYPGSTASRWCVPTRCCR